MKTKKQRIIIILSVIAFMLLVTAGGMYYRLHGSVRLKPSAEYKVSEDAVIYRQDDPSWAKDQLGESKYTMKSSGCLVSCIAAAVTMNGKEVTAGELNRLFSDSHVYDAEGNIQWNSIDGMEGYSTEVFTDVSDSHIENCLESDNFPIVRVRMGGLGNFHYVLIIGAENGEYICMDPLRDELTKLSDYGNRVYAIRCVRYEKEDDEGEDKEENEEDEEEAAVLPKEHEQLYETFLNMEYADHDYIYTYHDFDDDGIQELCLKQSDESVQSGYIIKYVDGGLQHLYEKKIANTYLKQLSWSETKSADDGGKQEMVHEGIYVYVSQNEYGKGNFWYLDESAFYHAFGFGDQEPLYEYYNQDGSRRLTLFYNEQTGEGCGVRYYERDPSTFSTSGKYGFTFAGTEEEEWSSPEAEYLKQLSVDGTDGSGAVSQYEENYEYDREGRVTHFDSAGIIDFITDDETQYILWIDYEYYDNGKIKHRSYMHNSYVFGTWASTWESYFDELGRVEYEDIYITHGSMDYYYIYFDDSTQPAYELVLDHNLGSWIPELKEIR